MNNNRKLQIPSHIVGCKYTIKREDKIQRVKYKVEYPIIHEVPRTLPLFQQE